MFERNTARSIISEKIEHALILMQPDEIRQAEDGRFIITLFPSNPYYQSTNPLAVAMDMLNRQKLKASPGYWSKTEEMVRFDFRCE